MPDAAARGGDCLSLDVIGGPPEAAGLSSGTFARLRTSFTAPGAAKLLVRGSRYAALVSINGTLVPALSGDVLPRQADISSFLRAGLNDIEVMLDIAPRMTGLAGLNDHAARLPEVLLVTDLGTAALEDWQVCPGLAGEAAGYPGYEVDTRRWHYLRFGPWRERGKDLAGIWGVGWYRMSLDLPDPGDWTIPYYARVELVGGGKLYWNGDPLATVQGDGTYVLPILAPRAPGERSNVLAAALYGLTPQTGLYAAEVTADEDLMTRRRTLEIRF